MITTCIERRTYPTGAPAIAGDQRTILALDYGEARWLASAIHDLARSRNFGRSADGEMLFDRPSPLRLMSLQDGLYHGEHLAAPLSGIEARWLANAVRERLSDPDQARVIGIGRAHAMVRRLEHRVSTTVTGHG